MALEIQSSDHDTQEIVAETSAYVAALSAVASCSRRESQTPRFDERFYTEREIVARGARFVSAGHPESLLRRCFRCHSRKVRRVEVTFVKPLIEIYS